MKRSREARRIQGARDCSASTHPDLFVFGAGCEVLAVWAEADAPDVQVARLVCALVDEHAKQIGVSGVTWTAAGRVPRTAFSGRS